MTKSNLLISIIVTIFATIFIYSCAKDSEPTQYSAPQTVENRSSKSACSPQTLYTEYPTCVHTPKTITIDFTQGPKIYSSQSLIKNLCPGLQVTVDFTHSVCTDFQGDEINFITNMTYSLANMIASCPALQNAINFQTQIGNLVSFLDRIDHDISMQLEYTMAYDQAKDNVGSIACNGTKRYSVKYIQNTCYKWESYVDGPKDRPIPAFIKVECNGTVCCARSNIYCTSGYVGEIPLIATATPVHYQKFEGTCPLECGHDCGAPPGFSDSY